MWGLDVSSGYLEFRIVFLWELLIKESWAGLILISLAGILDAFEELGVFDII